MLKNISALFKRYAFLAIFSCGAAASVSAQPLLTRGPYLQNGSSSSITIHWRTDVPTDSKVKYGTSASSLSATVNNPALVTEHIVKISGLSPYTKYYYSVGSSTLQLQSGPQNYFLTSPVPGQIAKYTFWINGDCGKNSTMQKNVRDAYLSYVGSNVTNGWLLLGDNAYSAGTDAEYSSQFFNVYQSSVLKYATLWPAPGNHDYANTYDRQNDHNVPYFSVFDTPENGEAGGIASHSDAFYSFDYGNIHFLSLDSYGREDYSTRLYDTTGAQVQWIKNDLAANNKKWVVAYFHHPPFTMGTHNSDTETELVKIRTNFIKILERMGVDLIVCGHSHDYERSKLMKGYYGNEASFSSAYNVSQSSGKYDGSSNSCTYLKDSLHKTGAVYIVAGSSGQVGSPQASYPHNAMYYSNNTDGGSMILEVEGDRLDAKWLCADGVIRDKFTIIKDANKVRNINVNPGASVTLTASWLGQYDWKNSPASSRSITFSPLNDTVCIVNDQYQCVADTFNITVNAAPSINLSSVSQADKCAGSAVALAYTISGSFTSGNQFKLQLSNQYGSFSSPANIGSITSTGAGTITGTLPATLPAGNYKMRVVSTTPSVISVSTSSFRIDPAIPVITFVSSDADNTVCAGTPVTFTAGGALTYQFFVNNISQAPAGSTNTFTANALADGDVIKVKGFNSCGSQEMTKTITVYTPQQASFTGLDPTYNLSDPAATLTGIPSGGVFSGQGISGSVFNPSTAGAGGPYTITYSYVDPHGCSDAATGTVMVYLSTGMESIAESGEESFGIYPNPTPDATKLVMNITDPALVEIKIIDVAGRVYPVFDAQNINGGTHTFQIDKRDLGLTAGMYFVRISIGKKQKVLRLTIQ
jgi:acid phosphatase type 7